MGSMLRHHSSYYGRAVDVGKGQNLLGVIGQNGAGTEADAGVDIGNRRENQFASGIPT